MRALTLTAAALSVAVLSPAARAHGIAGVARDVASGRGQPRAMAAASDQPNLPYDGGPVLHSNRTHLIFWEPSGSGLSFDPGYEPLIEQFLTDVGADSHMPTNVYGLTGQYTDRSGPAVYDSTYGGAVTDTDKLPSSSCVEPPATGPGWTVCLTKSQLQAEIERVVVADQLPTTPTDVYFLVTPKGLGSCTDSRSSSCALGGSASGYCGYHSITPDGNILYAVIPYNAVSGHCQSNNPRPNSSTADPTISTISHEHNEMITDPLGTAWVDSAGSEDGDRCITQFGPVIGGFGLTAWNEAVQGHHYYLQEEWSNDDHGCAPRDEGDSVIFAPSVRSGILHLTATAHDPDGSITGYLWQFGDGASARGRAVAHKFKRSGSYRVTLKVTDSSGNWALYRRAISVSAARDRRRSRRRSSARTKSG